MKFGDWDGLVKILLAISAVVTVIFAVMVLNSGDAKSISRMFGETILLVICVVWLWFLIPGFREDMQSAIDAVAAMFATQVPEEQLSAFREQALDLMKVSIGTGFLAMVGGAALAFAGGLTGAIAVKKAGG